MDTAVDVAIDLEVRLTADLYNVCHRVHDTPAAYHRSVDLLDRTKPMAPGNLACAST
jgi:hypothetical protein